MEEPEALKQTGEFYIAPGKNIYGELTFAGPNTCLRLFDNDNIRLPDIIHCINGTLRDLTKVTLLECVNLGTGSIRRGDEKRHSTTLFPHYILKGGHHIDHDEKIITEAHLVLEDGNILFCDYDAFGFVSNPGPIVEQIVKRENTKREIKFGDHPEFFYFTGRFDIFRTETNFGSISARHSPRFFMPGPDGLRVNNKVMVTLSFTEPCRFIETVEYTLSLLRYFEVIVGRQQNLLKFNLSTQSDKEIPNEFKIYWSLLPKTNLNGMFRPHNSDILVDPIRSSDEFGRMISSWFDKETTYKEARFRFSRSFTGEDYSIYRIITSANMFEILPDSLYPENVSLSEDLMTAKAECKEIFRRLPYSPERDSVLSALGRVGKFSLKQKIRHRAKIILDHTENEFPFFYNATDEAVNCRNHYVHGSEPTFNYSNEYEIFWFLTDTLEFVFGASDLIESGWKISSWIKKHDWRSHPFGRYCLRYKANIEKLQSLLKKSGNHR